MILPDDRTYNPIFKKVNKNVSRGFKFSNNKGKEESAQNDDDDAYTEKKIDYLNLGLKLSQIEEHSYEESREDMSKHHNGDSSSSKSIRVLHIVSDSEDF